MSQRRMLVYVPCSKYHPDSLRSIRQAVGYPLVDTVFDYSGNAGGEHRFDKITRKAESWRRIALAQGYDYFVTIEDDQIVPPNALQRLEMARILHDADVVYGLSVWRHDPTVWTAALSITENKIQMLTKVAPETREQYWDRVAELPGVHMGCTLMTRRALEAVTFQRRGPNCYDYYAAVDWQAQGIRQVTDFGLHVGHITDEGIAYPSLDPGNHRLVKEAIT